MSKEPHKGVSLRKAYLELRKVGEVLGLNSYSLDQYWDTLKRRFQECFYAEELEQSGKEVSEESETDGAHVVSKVAVCMNPFCGKILPSYRFGVSPYCAHKCRRIIGRWANKRGFSVLEAIQLLRKVKKENNWTSSQLRKNLFWKHKISAEILKTKTKTRKEK